MKVANTKKWRQTEFAPVPLSELFNEPEEEHDWVVDGLLVKSGISICAGKPKAGKTTLARQLAFCVSRGNPFLGMNSTMGLVLYLALEEKRSEVMKHFRAMGALGDEQIFIHAAAAPKNAVDQLAKLIEVFQPILVIIDPLFRFTRVTNSNDYSEVTNALEDLVTLSRSSEAHILLVHHMGKGGREGADGILGSTAIFGAVDAAILLNRSNDKRTFRTQQRYGSDINECDLHFDPLTRTMSIGSECPDVPDLAMSEEILRFLQSRDKPVSQDEIFKYVTGRKEIKAQSLRILIQNGQVFREGQGSKGKPFRYAIANILDSSPNLGEGLESRININQAGFGDNFSGKQSGTPTGKKDEHES